MVNKVLVYEALKRSEFPESNSRLTSFFKTSGQDRLISLLIHDVFGGEILKTHKNKNWHFYNRIDGERVDFTKAGKPFEKNASFCFYVFLKFLLQKHHVSGEKLI